MIPSINVNLTSCSCAGANWRALCSNGHVLHCPNYAMPPKLAAPVWIPCRIPPSITLTVSVADSLRAASERMKVACYIQGSSWDATRISDIERAGAIPDFSSQSEENAAREAVLERWALVVNLMLGHLTESGPEAELVKHRNAVFGALADMHRAEKTIESAIGTINSKTYATALGRRWNEVAPVPPSRAEEILAAYLTLLTEQVGVLP